MADVSAGKGTLGKLVTNDEMYNRVNSVAGRVDTVLEAVQTKQGTLGKLVYDPEIHDSAKTFLDNGNAFVERTFRPARAPLESWRRMTRCSRSIARREKIFPARPPS